MKETKNIILSSHNETLTEKAFKQSIAISIFGILLCMIALCSVTWAWFSTGVSSSSNNIKSAYCQVSVSVKNEDTELYPVNGKYTFTKDKDYEIKIIATGTAETAYCIFNIGGNEYFTVQIPTKPSTIDGVPTPNNISFTLRFTEDTEDVKIITGWGFSGETERIFKNGGYYLNLSESTPLVRESSETNPVTKAPTPGASFTTETSSSESHTNITE